MAADDPLKLDDFEMPKDKEGFDFYIRRKVLKIFGGSFHVYDARDNLVFFSSQKAFKLKEDIRVFSDESMSEECLVIKARSIIDFGAAYDVVDSPSGEKLGAFRRKGLKSILKDSWEMHHSPNLRFSTRGHVDQWLLTTVWTDSYCRITRWIFVSLVFFISPTEKLLSGRILRSTPNNKSEAD